MFSSFKRLFEALFGLRLIEIQLGFSYVSSYRHTVKDLD